MTCLLSEKESDAGRLIGGAKEKSWAALQLLSLHAYTVDLVRCCAIMKLISLCRMADLPQRPPSLEELQSGASPCSLDNSSLIIDIALVLHCTS
jgi:hypothetical protein